MEDSTRSDIRRLLKTFGIQADEEMLTHLARHPEIKQLQIRLELTDLTDYGDSPPADPLHLIIEGDVRG